MLPRSPRKECSVQVVARFRPALTEEERQEPPAFRVRPGGRVVETLDGAYHFDFDKAFPEAATQEAVYEYIGRPVVGDVLGGYNGTVFAYGQTGSGKTHAMFGPGVGMGHAELQGVVPRAARQIFDHIAAGADDYTEFTLRCSFLEVYREQMRDLLSPTNQKLRVKELPQRGLYVDGLSRECVTSTAELLGAVRAGNRSRSVARTRQNQHSSRSHAVFVLHVEQRSREGTQRLGKLTLVDLAGSEKVSKSECVGETLEEAKKINWSLSALGKVIDALAEQRPHVPYRDSRLTRVLEEALGGNCRTTLLLTASAWQQHYDETLSSLRFATRAKKVRNHAKVNYMFSSDQLLLLAAQLQRELAQTRRQLSDHGGAGPGAGPGGVAGASGGSSVTASPDGSAARRRSRCESSPEAGSLRLAPSGSAPALGLARPAGDEGDARRSCPSASGSRALLDIDELSCLGCASFASCGSARSLATPRSPDSEPPEGEAPVRPMRDDDEESQGPRSPHPDDEAWRPLALAARDAVWALEAALTAQEQALEEARLLRAQKEDPLREGPALAAGAASDAAGAAGSDKREGGAQQQFPGADALSERFRALRHAVDARRLQWRLQLERERADSLAYELEMRKRYSEELEQSLEEVSARPAEVLQEAGGGGTKAAGGLGEALRRLPLCPRGGGSTVVGAARGPRLSTCSSASTASAGGLCSGASSTAPAPRIGPRHPRIARPVPRRSPGTLAAGTRGHSVPALSRAGQDAGASPCPAPSLVPASPGASASSSLPTEPSTPVVVAAADSGAKPACAPSAAEGDRADGEAEALPVAGTGDTGDRRPGGADPQPAPEPEAASTQEQIATLQRSIAAMQEQEAHLQGELARRGARLTQLAAELSGQGVRAAALRHEVRVKDALLAHLRGEALRRGEQGDAEVERLMERAISTLGAILTCEQTAAASAAGERASLPGS